MKRGTSSIAILEEFLKEDSRIKMEKEIATHSGTLAWKIPWTEKPTVHGIAKSRTQLSDFTLTFTFKN